MNSYIPIHNSDDDFVEIQDYCTNDSTNSKRKGC